MTHCSLSLGKCLSFRTVFSKSVVRFNFIPMKKFGSLGRICLYKVIKVAHQCASVEMVTYEVDSPTLIVNFQHLYVSATYEYDSYQTVSSKRFGN